VADDDVTGDEIWTTDGTEEGTYLVADLNSTDDSNPDNFLNLYDLVLLMTAETDGAGEELVNFFLEENEDGTITGDFGVFDIAPGEVGSEPEDLVFTGYGIYFGAETAEFGRELYELSVFADAPVRISDINPDAGDGAIDDIILVDSTLFFEANDGVTGRELWKYEAGLPGFVVTSGGTTVMDGDTLDLGEVILGDGASAALDFAVENPGSQPTLIIEENYSALDDPFMLDNLGNPDFDSIPAMGSVPLQIIYTPTVEGENIQEVNVLAAVLDQPSLTFYVRGAGVAATADLQASVAEAAFADGDTLDFGDLFVSQDSVQNVILRNDGNIPLNIASAALVDAVNFTAEMPAMSLQPGAADTIAITFQPQTEGTFETTLTITSDATTDADFVINLRGSATVSSVRDLVVRAVNVYPNPTAGQLTIEMGEPLANGILRIFDLQGKLVYRAVWPEGTLRQQIELGHLPQGQYQLELGNGQERGVVNVLMH
jgi:ELWxxDGT repeat protein